MPPFTVDDITTGASTVSDGAFLPNGAGGTSDTLNLGLYDQSADSYAVAATGSDLYVLTGGGNDYIDTSGVTGFAFIDAYTGVNAITIGNAAAQTTVCIDQEQTETRDTLTNFHQGDLLTLNMANPGFQLSYTEENGGTLVTGTDAGSAPVSAMLSGVASSQDLQVTVGHGGSQANISMTADPPPAPALAASDPPPAAAAPAQPLSPDGAEVYRLYATALGRVPDASGQAFWTAQLQGGTSNAVLAQDFVGSQEFQSDYGSLSISDFVSDLYKNALHRNSDQAGAQYWTGQLTGGMSKASVVLAFADCSESRMLTASATGN